jgi:O-antigen/teichoic acid export membrane protein
VRGLSLIRGFAFMQLVPGLSNLILLILMSLVTAHQDTPVFALFASIAITALVGEVIMDRSFRRRSSGSDTVHPIAMKRVLSISAPMLMTALMTFVIGQTGVLMLGIMRTEEEVGHYAVAVQLAAVTAVMLQALNTMATPNYSKLFYSGKTDELLRVARQTSKLVFWVSLPVMLVLICFGEYVITLFYGQPFVAAYPPMIFLLIGKFVYAISGSTGAFMNMTGNQKPLLVIKASAALMNVLLNLWLIPVYGLNGAAVSAMVSLIFWNVAVLITIKNKFGRTIGYLPF